ncbi:MAG TPA: Uma2 family endonuclease, partial [Candidatus Caenarcaniphilales bacterium]
LFTVNEYHQMAQTGILSESDRVELLEGELVEMSPIGSRHAACVKRFNRLFSQRLSQRALVSIQDPIQLSERSEPQPDLVLLKPRADFYAQAHPQPKDILLIVEVADTSVDYDRQVKIPLYAQAGIIETWLLDLIKEFVEVYRQPVAGEYREIQQLQRQQLLSPLAFSDMRVTVSELLGLPI